MSGWLESEEILALNDAAVTTEFSPLFLLMISYLQNIIENCSEILCAVMSCEDDDKVLQ